MEMAGGEAGESLGSTSRGRPEKKSLREEAAAAADDDHSG